MPTELFTFTKEQDEQILAEAKQFAKAGNDHMIHHYGKSIDAYLQDQHPSFYQELSRKDFLTQWIMYFALKSGLIEAQLKKDSQNLQKTQITEIINAVIRPEIDDFVNLSNY